MSQLRDVSCGQTDPEDNVSVFNTLIVPFVQMKKDLMTQLLKADVQVVLTESVSEDACSALRRLKVSNQNTWFNVKKVNVTPVFIISLFSSTGK